MLPPSRREFLTAASRSALLLTSAVATDGAAQPPVQDSGIIPGLTARSPTGRRFLFYSDCCSGIPGGPQEKTHAAVNAMVARIRPVPEFVAFPGDAVAGYTTDLDELRRQWRYWTDIEMNWLAQARIPLYQSTSNHHTYDLPSEAVFREVHPHLPQNGVGEERGLAYAVRDGNLLYVSTHQPDRTRPYRRDMQINVEWLDAVLSEQADARFKIVAGHYPVYPVNGYTLAPQWCFRETEREQFWDVLVKHRVDAYLASHVIAFDAQIHRGIPQLVSGGAGTTYGPGGGMPGLTEVPHATEIVLDDGGLRFRVLDVTGQVREQLAWPISLPNPVAWRALGPHDISSFLAPAPSPARVVGIRIRGIPSPRPGNDEQTLLCGYDTFEGPPTLWIGLEPCSSRLLVRLIPRPGHGQQTWFGSMLPQNERFDIELLLHPGLGPGGILTRNQATAAWNSLFSTSSQGLESLHWPAAWTMGHGLNGPRDAPFQGNGLQVAAITQELSLLI